MVCDPILMNILRIQITPRLVCILPIRVSHKRHQMKDVFVDATCDAIAKATTLLDNVSSIDIDSTR